MSVTVSVLLIGVLTHWCNYSLVYLMTVFPSGQSDIDFLFDFVEVSGGPFSGLDVLGARPRAGKRHCSCVNEIMHI